MKKSAAIFDLIILAFVFWGAYYGVRFFSVSDYVVAPMLGPVVIGVSFLGVWLLLNRRGQTLKDIGLFKLKSWRKTFEKAGVAALVIFGATMVGFGIFSTLFGAPAAGTAIEEQTEDFLYFLFDIVVITWIFIAVGEEVFFRGFLLNRLQIIFAGFPMAPILAAFAQAIWFGSAHGSQGLTGVLITGLIGFSLALYFVYQKQPASLVPLIIAHAFVDTVVLSANYFSNAMG